MGKPRWLTIRHHRTASPRWRSACPSFRRCSGKALLDRATVEATLKEAGLYAQALCIDCSPEVERETIRIVKQIIPEIAVADASTAEATGQA